MKLRLGYNFEWLRVYFSPFKPIIPTLYIGRTAIGTPWFYPRRVVKATHKRAKDAAIKQIRDNREFNKNNPTYQRVEKSFRELYEQKMRCNYFVDKKVGFDFVGLGWKTKFDSYRFESNPVWSFVFFGYQIALIFKPENDMFYWESYLMYYYDTDKSKSPQERIKEAREKHPNVWLHPKNGVEIKTDYWAKILKNNEKFLG